jgi:hypothetical protein
MPRGEYHGRGEPGGTLREITGTKESVQHNREFEFRTRTEANAFRHGVELVNDSAIRVVDLMHVRYGKRGHRYVVLVQDDDFNEEAE